MKSTTIVTILLTFAMSFLLTPLLSPVYADTCSQQSSSWTPRSGSTITVTATACGTVGSNNLFKSESHSVTCSSTDSNLQPQGGTNNVVFVGFVGTQEIYSKYFSTTVGQCPNISKNFNHTVGCAETEVNLLVKDLLSGNTTTLAPAVQAIAPGSGTCPA